MKKTIKSVITLIVAICVLLSMFTLNAFADGSTSVAFSKSTLNVGETLTVTVRFKASEKMYGVEAKIQYDSKLLQYVSAPNGPESASGIVHIVAAASGTDATETVTFKAVGTGSGAISVSEAIYAADQEVAMKGSSANISVVDKAAEKSSNADLKYITPSAGSLTPNFSANTTSYSITIPNSVTVLTLGAGTAHSGANWDVEGSKNMKVGSNQRVIVVTAEDGTTKKYTLNITREGTEGDTSSIPEAPTTDNKISVTADGRDMYIANEFNTENVFSGYSLDVYVYNSVEFPCLKREDNSLLYLTDETGENGGFYIPQGDGSFKAFKYVNTKTGFYEFLDAEEIPEGYSPITMNIDGCDITAYQNIDPTLTEFALVFAKGPQGYVGFYRYDAVEHTMQRAIGAIAEVQKTEEPAEVEGSIIDRIMALEMSEKIIMIVIVGAILLILAAIIVLIVKLARPSVYEEIDDEEYDDEETEDMEPEFDVITISDRDEE